MKLTGTKALLFLAVLSSGVTAYLYLSHRQEKQQRLQRSERALLEGINRVSSTISTSLTPLMRAAEGIAKKISAGELTISAAASALSEVITANATLAGGGVLFPRPPRDPAAEDATPAPPENIRFIRRARGKVVSLRAAEGRQTDRPHKPSFSAGSVSQPGWVKPRYDAATKQTVVDYAVPLRPAKGAAPAGGTLYVTFALITFDPIFRKLELGATGYGGMVTRAGYFLYHPTDSLVVRGENLLKRSKQYGDQSMYGKLEAMLAAKTDGTIDIGADSYDGRDAWLYYKPILQTDWVLLFLAFKDEFLPQTADLYQLQVWYSLALILSVLFGVLFLVYALGSGRRRLIWAVGLLSFAMVASIVAVWYMALVHPPRPPGNKVILVNPAGVNGFLRRVLEVRHEVTKHPPLQIPTGVFINSTQFVASNEVTMTGYVWQVYPPDYPAKLTQGIVLPDAIRAWVTEAYHLKTKNGEVKGWSFTVKLRLPFNYARYPFDSQQVSLRLWHKDFGRNVVLVPDFASYNMMNPLTLPGLNSDLVLPGWGLTRSFFEYRLKNYNTNFGLTTYDGQNEFPELNFVIELRRDFLNGMLNTLVRPLVVAVLLFSLVILIRKQAELKYSGFNASGLIGTGGGFMLFVLAGDQRSLRETLSATGVVYAEFYYFALYLLILLVVVNTLLFIHSSRLRILEKNENLLIKLLYWPTFLAFILFGTLWTFA